MPGDPFPGLRPRARSIGPMADLYALDLAFDLLDTTPDDVLTEVRRQLTGTDCSRPGVRRGASAACSSGSSARANAEFGP